MQLNDVRTMRRQEAHRKAIELRDEHQFDEAISLMMHALQSYGPNILLLIDVANLFKFQNEIGNYYYYGRKIEQEWIAYQDKITEQTKADVAQFLALYFYDRGQAARSFYYLDLSSRAAATTDQHIMSLAHLLNLNAEFKNAKQVQELYLECLKLKDVPGKHQILVERALLKSEIEIVGYEQAFHRLEKYSSTHGVVETGFHHLLIDYILKCLLKKVDLNPLREKLFGLLNQINPMELSTFDKIVIQFFDQPHYFLHAQEMTYLQQRFNQSELFDVYYLNYLACADQMVREDLRALFQLMIREVDASTHQLLKQKYFNETIVQQKWKLYLNTKSRQLISLDGMLPLKKEEFALLAIFGQENRSSAAQLAIQFQTQFELKELVMRVNQKIYTLTGIADALTSSTSEVKLLESIDIIQKN